MSLKNYLHSLIVFSYGRTGSVLLAANLRNSLHGHQTAPVYHIKTLPYDFVVNDHTVFHTHLMFDKNIAAGHRRVFSIRQNPIEQMLSFIFVNQYQKYHLLKSESTPALEPFIFKQWEFLDKMCESCKNWHSYFAQQLTEDDLVVSYEIFTRGNRINSSWQRLYPDKFKILINHSDVADYVIKKMNWLDDLEKFLSHKNQFDIYQYTTGAIR